MKVPNCHNNFIFSLILYIIICSSSILSNDIYWQTQFKNRPEIIFRNEFANLPKSSLFSQGFLYTFTKSNKSKVCFCGEYKYLNHSFLLRKKNLFSIRSRINNKISQQTQWFIDYRVSHELNITANFGISHSRGPWYGSVIFEGNYKDLETPDIWLKEYHSISGKLWTSLALTEKLFILGYFARKQYMEFSQKARINIDRINIEPSIDFYLFGSPETISGNIFDSYENLSPIVYNRSLVLSIVNSIELMSGSNTTTVQHVRMHFSLPMCNYYGFTGSTSIGKNFIKSNNDSSVHWSLNIGGYLFFSKRIGIFYSYNSYNPSGITFQTTNNKYEVSVNYNL